NANITIPVIEHIEYLYSYFNGSLHKIRKSLKKEHNIEISHQSIENIILKSEYEIEHRNWTFSGYYLFDALWVKKNGKWKYLLALFDLELNTIVAKELVESETVENVYDFLNQSLRNQKKKKNCIITDLKSEYRVAIDKLQIKQQFCTFHTKQLINREIRDHIDKNNASEEEIEIIRDYKSLFLI
ncbi:DDE-type integrase/transposase/recombinase, partial [uncultured Methanobrevibacter sp.]|uniref:DDE-type integrase/transposase/recombinase n=1 Tax=uncultured Methanobrevibacter sp. TaxID=253161 RepID=UPI0025DBFF00